MRNTLRNALLVVMAMGLLAAGGCYVSDYALEPATNAVIKEAYLGTWTIVEQTDDPPVLIVQKQDEHQYAVTWKRKGEEDVKLVAWITQVGGSDFAQAVNPEEEKLSYWIMRVEVREDKLLIRQLKEDFFKSRVFHSSEELRRVIEANVNNPAMYDRQTTVATLSRPSSRPTTNAK